MHEGNHHVAGSLASRGAQLNVLHPDSGESALHAAAYHVHVKVVKELLAHGADPNLYSELPRGETPLHCVVRAAQNPRAQWTRARALQCLRVLLLHSRIKVDRRDIYGLSPVHLAAHFELWEFVESLIAAGANIDLNISGETTRQLLERNNPSRQSLIPPRDQEPVTLKLILYDQLRNGEQDQFIASFTQGNPEVSSTTLQRFLQIASVSGYTKLAKFLIERGADPNSSVNNTQVPPIILAAKFGYHETLRVLIEAPAIPPSSVIDHPLWRRSALHHVAISAADVTTPSTKTRNFVTCASLLLQHARLRHLNVDAKDFLDNTAIHYASKSGRRDIIRVILNHKPAIFIKNRDNIPTFTNVHPHDLRKYLDSCINVKSSRHEKFPTLVFDYRFLETPSDTSEIQNNNNLETKTNNEEIVSSETETVTPNKSPTLEMEPLLLLSNSPVHRQLLNHPIIRSFLHLKWQRVKHYFYVNFALYLLFTITLSLHIHMLISSTFVAPHATGSSPSEIYEYSAPSAHNIIRWIAAVFLLWPLCREILEMCMSLRRYVRDFENVIETILVSVSIVLLFVQTDPYCTQILSAIAILLAYTDLVLLIGRHPRFATFINMFTKVSKHFLGFFFLFSFLIFAFAYSFFIIFHNCVDNQTCETRFFVNLGSSVFKTIVMLTGELESESLTFDVFSYLLFTCFILFMTICLLNLLTGLAVSDIAAIRDEAEVDSCRAKVKLYAKIESILLGQSIEGLGIRWLGRRLSAMAEHTFAGKVRLLGHSLSESRLEVLLAADRSNELYKQKSWRSGLLGPCLGRSPSSGQYHEWDAIVNEAHTIAVGEEQLWQGRGLPERLEGIETRLAELLNILNRPQTDPISVREHSYLSLRA
ncbi:hypothetical protein B566_EDAN011423 [Ephemera danica]|nr:hypothetical protein B566_EDAN011423 [Ephemera danica]